MRRLYPGRVLVSVLSELEVVSMAWARPTEQYPNQALATMS